MLAALVVAAIGVSAGAGAAAAPASVPGWQLVRGANADDGTMLWAAGRLWFWRWDGPSAGRTPFWASTRTDLKSASVAGGRLGPWKAADAQTKDGESAYVGVVGNTVVFAKWYDPAGTAPLSGVELLPDGRVGEPAVLGGAPTPSSSVGSQVVQLPDRAVHLIQIGNQRHEFSRDPGACCDVDGHPVDFASLVSARAGDQIGLDRHGRLWLAWGPPGGIKPPPAMVELDPQTLRPRGEPRLVPGLPRFARINAMVCAEICRLVIEGVPATASVHGAQVFDASWAPGEGAPTEIHLPIDRPGVGGSVIAARDVGDHLLIGYWEGDENHMTVALARTDPRGRNVRIIRTMPGPTRLGHGEVTNGTPYGIFGPDGLFMTDSTEIFATSKFLLRWALFPLDG